MNKVHDVPAEESPAAAAANAAADDAGAAADAPRRRRPRKTAEAVDGSVAPAAGHGDALPAGAEEPRRRGRPRKTPEVEADAPAGVTPPMLAEAGAADAVQPPAPAQAARPARAEHQPPAFEFTLGPPAESPVLVPAGDGADGGGIDAPRARGDRNRRRGRRGRGERQEAGGPVDGAVDQDGQAADAPPRAPRPLPDAGALFAEVISGAFDAEVVAPPALPVQPAAGEPAGGEAPVTLGKRVLRPEPEAPKLHKVLAQSGIGSRRDMEQLIQDGRVTVNGEPAHIGMRVAQGDRIAISGKPVKVRIAPPTARVLAYHKPVGEVVTFSDPEGRPTVFRNLPRLPQGKWQSVGRLDINTEGLLLFTTSGDLANQLMHPRFGVEREYAVRVLGELDADLRAELLEGVQIDGQRCAFRSIEEGGGDGANRWYRVVITEGRHREVRRMFEEVGLVVNRLIRIRYGVVVLPKGLHRGEWVELDDDDVRAIRRLAHAPGQEQGGPGHPHGGQGDGQRAGAGKGGRDRPQRGKHRNERPAPAADYGEAMPAQAAQGDDFGPEDPLHIPNPLEQTFDRRFATGSKRITAGFGRPSDDHRSPAERKGAKGMPKQPDPMQTSVGYIGADAYFTKPGGGGRRRGGGGGGGGGRGR